MQKLQKNTLIACLMCMIMLAASLCFFIPTTFAEESDLTDKELFAIEAKAKFAKIAETSPAVIADDPDLILEQLTYLNQIGADEAIRNQLGFFTYVKGTPDPSDEIMPTADSDDGIASDNGPEDVSLESPTVTYHEPSNTWNITTKGAWKNNKWNTENLGKIKGSEGGKLKSLGGKDRVGFEFSEVEQDYTKLGITRLSAYVEFNKVDCYKNISRNNYSYLKTHQITSTSVDNASGAAGVIMEFQDSLVTQHQDWYWYDYSYDAKSFDMSASYNGNFAKLNGNVTTLLYHDYSYFSLTSVTVSSTIVNGLPQPTFTFNITKSTPAWVAYSGAQTRF